MDMNDRVNSHLNEGFCQKLLKHLADINVKIISQSNMHLGLNNPLWRVFTSRVHQGFP